MSSKLARTICVAATLALATLALVAAMAGAAAGTKLRAERLTLQGAIVHGVDRPIRVTAVGPISGHGTAQDNDRPNGTGVLIVSLPQGSVYLTNKTVALATHVNLRKCTATIIERGTFRIVRGTRRFAHASGAGTYTNQRKLIGSRTSAGKCAGKNAPPKAEYVTVILIGKADVSSH